MTTAGAAVKTFRVFDKATLIDAAEIAEQRGYNRQLDVEYLSKLLEDGFVYPVSMSLLHEHANGVKVDPHVRCMIVLSAEGNFVMLDVDMDIFNSLEVLEVRA